jgi:inorganic pyrophosphatase
MTSFSDERYWQALQTLLLEAHLVIDRPRGQAHPRYPDLVYPLDYGYLEGTTAGDGGGIDVWIGSLGSRALTGILCTFDTVKRDAEIKLLAGCSALDVETIRQFNNLLYTIYIPRPLE